MVNPTRPPKFNAKARQSSIGGSRKKRVGKKNVAGTLLESGVTQEPVDPNSDIIVPKSKLEREQDRKERLRQEV
jgi:ATP-dependent RNA helicase DHX37/DHR1